MFNRQVIAPYLHISFTLSLSTTWASLVPRPFEGEEKGPGTHCLRMLRYPKNLRGSDTIVFCLVYLPFDLNTVELARSKSDRHGLVKF